MDPKTLFTSPYDQKTFTKLLKGLLWDEYQDEGRYETKEIWHGFEYLTHYSRLGDIELDNGWYKEQVLVLEITQKSINDARVSITKETIKLLKKDIFQWYYTVLVAFRSEANPDNWRFSLIKSNDGKSWNNARRFSYYLGKNEGYKTPKQYLIDAGQIKDLNDLVSRFDVEVVRKEFFNLYINLFLELYQEVKKYQYCFRSVNNGSLIDLVSFSKNLMGKMIFLYFIQKKGWLWLNQDQNFKDHPGDPQFFKNNFDTRLARDENLFQWWVNFYNDFLEPLFYSGLNKKNPNDWHEKLQMKVPYLNGWLFEEEYKDRETTPLPLENNLFKAIVDAFDTYNFTIDENDPMDQEIAVDPEMLGKIFEYMISINSEKIDTLVDLYNQKKKFKEYPSPDRSVNIVVEIQNNRDLNKKLWAYYTRREIVHYMTRESLIYSVVEFLWKQLSDQDTSQIEMLVRKLWEYKDKHLTSRDEIDGQGQMDMYKKLQSVALQIRDYLLLNEKSDIKPLTILDPAVWSGAFPMGILQEMVGLVEYIFDTFELWEKSRYEIKQSIIRDSIYGVDIDPGAVDIARLRFWLSLIVDAPEPIPLPNLEFKFVCANSLIPLENDSLFTNKTTIERLKIIKDEYFKVSDSDKKEELRAEFNALKSDLLWFTHKMRHEFETGRVGTIKYKKHIAEVVQENTDLKNRQFQSREPFDNTKSNSWFSPDIIFNKPKFDIIIWNPPYLEFEELRLKDFNFEKYKSIYGVNYKFNLYTPFTLLNKFLLSDKGIISYIIPNSFSKEKFNQIPRKEYINKTILKLVDFSKAKNNEVFDWVSNDWYIIYFVKNKVIKDNTIKIDEYNSMYFSHKKTVSQDFFKTTFQNQFNFSDYSNLVNLIEKNTIPLWDIAFTRVWLTPSKAYKKWYEDCDKSNLEWFWWFITKNSSVEGIQKQYTLRNWDRNIFRDRDLLYADRVAPWEKEDYMYEKIILRNRGSKIFASYCKWLLFYNDIFNGITLKFHFKKDRVFSVEDVELSKRYNILYILWIINSDLIQRYLANKFSARDIKSTMINLFPIRVCNKDTLSFEQKIIQNVQSLLNNFEIVSKRAIDILVYKLYELTLEDSQIVDPTLTQDEWDRVNFE